VSERAVLDTAILIDDRAPVYSGDVAISVASVAELQFGVLVAKDEVSRAQRLARFSAVQTQFPEPLLFDSEVASIWADLAARTAAAGRQPRRRYFDLVIAATAIAHQATLLTLNIADFEHLTDVLDLQLPPPRAH
jgi:predicted nucleic acid-binding protein